MLAGNPDITELKRPASLLYLSPAAISSFLALSNFVKDFACRNEVIAKFKNRKPISEIVKELTFPISEESVVAMIWDYLIENNIILLHESGSDKNLQYDIVEKDG